MVESLMYFDEIFTNLEGKNATNFEIRFRNSGHSEESKNRMQMYDTFDGSE